MRITEFLPPIRALVMEYHMLPAGAHVLLACSGGRDSMALLVALTHLQKNLSFSLSIAHFNHHLRGAESDRDQQFVLDYCTEHGLPCFVSGADVAGEAKRQKKGIEETARHLRYAFLEDTAKMLGASCIATAHHADDNLETLLLHFCRGSGLRGLRGIEPLRGKCIRPLLSTTREAIDAFVEANDIPFVEDSSNADESQLRNHIRHSILPQLQDINPQIVAGSVHMLRSLREDEAYLTAQAEGIFRREVFPVEHGMHLMVSTLKKYPPALSLRVLRRILEHLEAPMPSAVHLKAILLLAKGEEPSARLPLSGGILVQRMYSDVLISWDYAHTPQESLERQTVYVPGVTHWGDYVLHCMPAIAPEMPAEAGVFYLKPTAEPWQMRPRQEGDAFASVGRPTKRLKKWMIEAKIPRQERERIPVLVAGDVILAVAELGVSREATARAGEESLRCHWTKVPK